MLSVLLLGLLPMCCVHADLPGLAEFSPLHPDVQQEIVSLHNTYRRSVEPPASNMLRMNWSSDVAQSAQKWANTCAMSHGPASSRMIKGYECGENLFQSDELLPWSSVVGAWHSEVQNYQYPIGSKNGEVVGHYTQVIWYGSYEVGCGVAQCDDSLYFYSCQYFRAGNFRGVPPYSLGSPCEECPDNCDHGLCTNPCPYIDAVANCASLEEKASCEDTAVKNQCPSLCECKDKIRPVARK